ncbi:MAG: glutathione S-transferase N-terminal domain-containing protein [Phenylobacterium sp.]|uniref:glutathione S-transferase N-terminal domain-containing protein n=1 Tax=Phenylobacterium sp. TaxID=1871053 RepID=UPI001A53AE9E|nr:glutathione S-transferase N-terminal domain-containing protein [Phenylobacterium sp.]MBL8770323.1 glutathione S-transferase N-terminal domain-containing protein [Phenylobacterium sp.]
MIDLHFTPTPNGQKISIALEELELPYRLISYDIFEGEQHTAEFGRINPNHKLPAIVDHDPPFGGGPHAVFESAAILQYLAEKTGRLLPADPRQRSVAIQWLTWQAANLGPMGGQAAHFTRYAREEIPYAINRYTSELTRLLTVLERRLGEAAFLGGEEYSIADIAVWPGRYMAPEAPEYPNTMRWRAAIAQRPAVIRGRDADKAVPPKYAQRRAVLTAEEWSNLFGERMLGAVRL